MQPYRDEDLISYLYGESTDAAALEARVETDADLRARLDEIRALMATVSERQWAAPPADHEARMWQRLAPELVPHRPFWLGRWWQSLRQPSPAVLRAVQRAVAVAAVLTLVVGAFLLGRHGRPPNGPASITIANERILLTTIGEHLSRSHMVLSEMANAPRAADGNVALPEGPASARTLLIDNRLLRQTATQGGQPQVAAVLEALERVLTELANLPADRDPAHFEAVRQRIEDQDLLFKLRVLDQTVERAGRALHRQRSAPAGDHI